MSGREARLQGVNLGGWLTAGAGPTRLAQFVDDGDLARLASWRFSHVRLPLPAALLDAPEAWAALDSILAACERHRLRCVLALHLGPGEQAGLFADEGRWRAFVTRWRAIAQRYRHAPDSIGYDLLDRPAAPDDLPTEALAALGAARLSPAAARRPATPGATGGRAWNALAVKLTQAIRELDERHTIVVESNDGASVTAFTHLRPTRDPHTHYSFHCFEPRAFTMQGTACVPAPHQPHLANDERDVSRHPDSLRDQRAMGKSEPLPRVPDTIPEEPVIYPGTIAGERWDRARLEQRLVPALEFRRVYEAPLYLGAFGVSAAAPRSSQLTWVRSVLSLCRAHAVGWAYWTYKGGPFGLIGDPDDAFSSLERYHNTPRLDYDLLGVLQSEA